MFFRLWPPLCVYPTSRDCRSQSRFTLLRALEVIRVTIDRTWRSVGAKVPIRVISGWHQGLMRRTDRRGVCFASIDLAGWGEAV